MIKYLGYRFSTSKLYLFPGQGTQEKGMFNSLNNQYSDVIKQVSNMINLDLIEITQIDKHKIINKPHVAQPLVVLSSYLQTKAQNIQIKPNDYLIGHSIGQYTALLLAKSFKLQDCMKITKLRGQLIQKYTQQQSGMLVVIAKTQDLQLINTLIKQQQLQIGCYNTLTQIVISGTKSKTRQLYKKFKTHRILCTFLPVEAAFHCSTLKQMAQQFRTALNQIQISPPKGMIIRNYDCQIYKEKNDIIQGLVMQLYNPVQFYKSIIKIHPQVQYIQLSHKPVVTRFIKQIRK